MVIDRFVGTLRSMFVRVWIDLNDPASLRVCRAGGVAALTTMLTLLRECGLAYGGSFCSWGGVGIICYCGGSVQDADAFIMLCCCPLSRG